ncbi:MAG: hypothetical protein ABIH67_04715 [Candidatus Uhrbacteria bacterium]
MEKIKRTNTLLIVPVNDEEAYTIAELGDAIKMQVHRSKQPHGARLEDESGVLDLVKKSDCSTVIVVEMPGPEIEEQIRNLGKELIIIDHHRYTDLDRAHDSEGHVLPSSLEQFLNLVELSDQELDDLGYNAKMVRATGLWDEGYIWALIENGYSTKEIEQFEEHKEIIENKLGLPTETEESRQAAERAWKDRQEWNGFQIMHSADDQAHIRSLVSRMAAKHYKKRTPVIISERAGKRIYVQESDRAVDLYKEFGGFMYGGDWNWGYDNNERKKQLKLDEVKKILNKK